MGARIALAVMVVALVGYLDWSRTQWIKQATAAQIEAAGKTAALEFKSQTAQMSQEHANKIAEKDATIAANSAKYEREVNGLRNTIEQDMLKAPFDTANDVERRVAYRMCRYEAGNNSDLREACDIRKALPYSPKFAATVAVTPETAEQWAELCESTGKDDYCGYAVTGFTREGILKLLSWMDAVDTDQLRLRNDLEDYKLQIKEAGRIADENMKQLRK